MLLSKNNVDKYVKEILEKLKTEKERNLRCYSIAQKYYKVNDFESAIKYMTIYLKEKPDSHSGYKILAQCYERQGDNIRALEYYRCSLRYNIKQPDLVIKVCELLYNTKTENVSREHIQFWVKEAQQYDPQHPAVLGLSQRIMMNTNNKSEEEKSIQDVQTEEESIQDVQSDNGRYTPASSGYTQSSTPNDTTPTSSVPQREGGNKFFANTSAPKAKQEIEYTAPSFSLLLKGQDKLEVLMTTVLTSLQSLQIDMTYIKQAMLYNHQFQAQVPRPPVPPQFNMFPSGYFPPYPPPVQNYPLPTGPTVYHPPSQVPPQQGASIPVPPIASPVPSPKLQPAPPVSAPTVVVITSSDVLPTTAAAAVSQPTLSVTIPPQFRLGNVLPTGKAPPASTSEKSTYGGFTFTSAPVIKPIEKQKPEPAPPKPLENPFASLKLTTSSEPQKPFSFSPGFLSPVTKTVTVTTSAATTSADTGIGFKSGTVDFAALSKEGAISPAFSGKKETKGFEGAGSLVFGSPKNTSVSEPSTSHGDDFVPTAEFKPVITLPDVVEVVTGEEGLEVLYEERCKLLRYADKEWKERGIGKMKILYDKQNGRVRLVMRREQVHKVCCNQYLTKNHELKALATTDKAWSWYAKDYSEGELRDELLAVRFKTAEQAKEFKKAVDDAKLLVGIKKGEPSGSVKIEKWICLGCSKENAINEKKCLTCGFLKDVEIETGSETSEEQSDDEAPDVSQQSFTKPADSSWCAQAKTSLSEMFKPKEGSWECKTCYVRNELSTLKCISCNTNKEGITQKTVLSSPQASVIPSHSKAFGSLAFSDLSQSSEKPTFLVPETKPFGGFATPEKTKDSEPKTKDSEPKTKDSKPFFSFNIPSSGFSFTPNSKNVFTFGASAATSISPSSSTTSVTTGTKDSKPFTLLPTATPSSEISRTTSEESETDEGIVFVSQTVSAEEDKQRARELMLPENFFAYKYTDRRCPGCVGCETEEKDTLEKPEPADTKKEKTEGLVFSSSLLQNKGVSKDDDKPETKIGSSKAETSKKDEKDKQPKFQLKQPTFVVENESAVSKEQPISIFGSTDNVTSTQSSVFKFGSSVASSTAEQSTTKPTEAMASFSFASPPKTTKESIFGTSSKPVFGSAFGTEFSLSQPAFGTGSQSITSSDNQVPHFVFGNSKSPDTQNSTATPSDKPQPEVTVASGFALKGDELSFSSLASSSTKPGFSKVAADFKWPGAGTSIFGSAPSEKTVSSKDNKDKENEEEVGDEKETVVQGHDPHFEPIVPLPDEIVVRTGEEDEQIVFCSRGKVFRYSSETKEWKERGVGEVKVLHDPVRQTYRLLCRREQVHKVVLNQRLIPSFTLQRMDDKSWCWIGMNMPEEFTVPQLEKLAVRFKTSDIALEFQDAILGAVHALESLQDKPHEAEFQREIKQQSEQKGEGNNSSDSNEYEDYDRLTDLISDGKYYVDEPSISEAMKECGLVEQNDDGDDKPMHSLYSGQVTVHCVQDQEFNIYDGVVNVLMYALSPGGKVVTYDTEGATISSTPITPEFLFQQSNKTCSWTDDNGTSITDIVVEFADQQTPYKFAEYVEQVKRSYKNAESPEE